LDMLVAEGLIYKRRGAGTFVMDLSVEKMEKVLMDNQMMGTTASYPDKNITSKVIDFSVVKATPEIADKLKIKETSFVYKIHRVRIVDDKPT
ncbi:UTRA domain-containing protein, partial [Pediococcus acidilactici]